MTRRDERARRAEAIRPKAKQALDEMSERQLAEAVGVRAPQVSDFLDADVVPQEGTLQLWERWAADGDGEGGALAVREPRSAYGNFASIRKRLDEILGSDLQSLEKSSLIVDVALALRAEALANLTATARTEAESAARRQNELAAARAAAVEAAEEALAEEEKEAPRTANAGD